jgi:hypothetical protein
VSTAGDTIAESQEGFPSITAAVAQGVKTLTTMNVVDNSRSP